MRNQFGKIAIGCVLAVAGIPSAAYSQAPAPAAPNGSVVVASPTYTSIPMEITVNRSAAEVWKRIGKYCDVSEWLQIPAGCRITSGTDGEFGAVRTVGAEVLVGRTELSYTYAQTPKEGTPYNLYHGTLEARPVTPNAPWKWFRRNGMASSSPHGKRTPIPPRWANDTPSSPCPSHAVY